MFELPLWMHVLAMLILITAIIKFFQRLFSKTPSSASATATASAAEASSPKVDSTPSADPDVTQLCLLMRALEQKEQPEQAKKAVFHQIHALVDSTVNSLEKSDDGGDEQQQQCRRLHLRGVYADLLNKGGVLFQEKVGVAAAAAAAASSSKFSSSSSISSTTYLLDAALFLCQEALTLRRVEVEEELSSSSSSSSRKQETTTAQVGTTMHHHHHHQRTEFARSLHNVGNTTAMLGIELNDNEKQLEGISLLQEAIEVRKEILSQHSTTTRGSRNNGENSNNHTSIEASSCSSEQTSAAADLANSYEDLAGVLWRLRRHEEAVASMEASLDVRQEHLPPVISPAAATAANKTASIRSLTVLLLDLSARWKNLGLLQVKVGRLDDAILSYRRALEMHRKATTGDDGLVAATNSNNNSDDADLASLLNNLGYLLERRCSSNSGALSSSDSRSSSRSSSSSITTMREEALKLKQEALSIQRRLAKGNDDPELAIALNNVGSSIFHLATSSGLDCVSLAVAVEGSSSSGTDSNERRKQRALDGIELMKEALEMRRSCLSRNRAAAAVAAATTATTEGDHDDDEVESKKESCGGDEAVTTSMAQLVSSLRNVGNALVMVGRRREGITLQNEAQDVMMERSRLLSTHKK